MANWAVPVTADGRYWGTEFYAPGFATSAAAETSVRVSLEELKLATGIPAGQKFKVGRAVRLSG